MYMLIWTVLWTCAGSWESGERREETDVSSVQKKKMPREAQSNTRNEEVPRLQESELLKSPTETRSQVLATHGQHTLLVLRNLLATHANLRLDEIRLSRYLSFPFFVLHRHPSSCRRRRPHMFCFSTFLAAPLFLPRRERRKYAHQLSSPAYSSVVLKCSFFCLKCQAVPVCACSSVPLKTPTVCTLLVVILCDTAYHSGP